MYTTLLSSVLRILQFSRRVLGSKHEIQLTERTAQLQHYTYGFDLKPWRFRETLETCMPLHSLNSTGCPY